MKLARLPLKHDLDSYDYGFESAMSTTQLKRVRELNRLDQCYNIMLSSPTGTGKTYIAADLAYNAICKRNKAFFSEHERYSFHPQAEGARCQCIQGVQTAERSPLAL
jgi:DNA replication protein DnaC